MSREEAETTMATTGLRERVARLLWPEAEIRTWWTSNDLECGDPDIRIECEHPADDEDVARFPVAFQHHHDYEALWYRLASEFEAWELVPEFGEPSPEGWSASRTLTEALFARQWYPFVQQATDGEWMCELIGHGYIKAKGKSLPEALALAFCEAMEAHQRAEGATP